jgi:Flp pilus assembly protein TadG
MERSVLKCCSKVPMAKGMQTVCAQRGRRGSTRRAETIAGRLRGSRGQAAVEFALILPVLMLVLFGCLKVGVAFFSYEELGSAATAGARAAAVNHGTDPTSAAQAAAKSISPTLGLSNSQIAVTYVSAASPAGTSWSYPGNVTVTVTYPLSFGLFGQLEQTVNLQASATKRLER